MDPRRFDTLARSLTTPGSRRRALAATLGGALALVLGATSIEEAAAKKKKPCPPCKKRKKRKCKGTLPDGTGCSGGSCQNGSCIATAPLPVSCPGKVDLTPCGGGKKCSGGVCATEPTCLPQGGQCNLATPTQCCSGDCVAMPGNPNSCLPSVAGERCFATSDCATVPSMTCVGFICTQ